MAVCGTHFLLLALLMMKMMIGSSLPDTFNVDNDDVSFYESYSERPNIELLFEGVFIIRFSTKMYVKA